MIAPRIVPSDVRIPWNVHRELARGAELRRYAREGRARFRPDASYRGETYNDYEGEHDRILHCSGTILALQKTLQIHR